MELKKNEKPSSLPMENKLPFERITASMIKCYKSCPKLFYYQYVLAGGKFKNIVPKSIPLVFGGAFHKGVEAFYEGKDPVNEFLSNFVDRDLKNFRDPKVNEKFLENQKDGILLMQAWKEEAPKINALHNISPNGKSEQGFKIIWPHPEQLTVSLPIPISGRYDRITEQRQILEFKTSKKPYKQEDVDQLDQSSIYNYSYFLENNTWPEIFYIVFIKGRKNNPIQVLKTTRTKESITETYNMIQNILIEIKRKGTDEKEYPYGDNFMHKYCDCKLYEEILLL